MTALFLVFNGPFVLWSVVEEDARALIEASPQSYILREPVLVEIEDDLANLLRAKGPCRLVWPNSICWPKEHVTQVAKYSWHENRVFTLLCDGEYPSQWCSSGNAIMQIYEAHPSAYLTGPLRIELTSEQDALFAAFMDFNLD